MSEQTEKAQFTPGPLHDNGTLEILDNVGDHHLVRHVGGRGGGFALALGDTDEKREANARLISASPDMYKALKQVAAETGGSHGPASDYVTAQTAKAVRAALNKADGRE